MNGHNFQDGYPIFHGQRLRNYFPSAGFKRGSCICAHAWIFFKLCMIMTRYNYTNYENVYIELDS